MNGKKKKFSDLKAGQEFVIIGRKTPHGFISLEDGLTHYGLDGDTPIFIPSPIDIEEDTNQSLLARFLRWLLRGG